MSYDENSIISLNWREGIRQNLGMYIGDASSSGLQHLMVEIVANSIDEAAAGFGKNIIISIDTKLNQMSIKDEGRGIPFRKNSSGRYAIIDACTNTHAGGKFEGGTGYKSSLGLHGLGIKLVNALSTMCNIEIDREDGHCEVNFKDGQLQTAEPIIIDRKQKKTGTTVTFIPDTKIFGDLQWNIQTICDRIQTDALLNNNINFIINVDNKLYKKYYYTDGTKDLFYIKSQNKELVTDPIFFSTSVVDDKNGASADVSFAFAYSSSPSETIYSYVNGGYTPNDGTHVTGWKSAYTSFINKALKEKNLIKDKNLTGETVRRGLILVLVVKANFRLAFAEQTKYTLNSPEARGLVSKVVGQLVVQNKLLDQVLNKVVTEQKAEEAAQRKREAQEKIARGGKSMNALKDLPEKLADASDFNDAELFLVEGDSAAGGARESKNASQAVLPLRGEFLPHNLLFR